MKKYLKLTTNEAIRHFLFRDKTLVPETSFELREKINDLKDLKSDICVTITMPTHRYKPDYHTDMIQLKNLITETEQGLSGKVDKRMAASIIENIREAQGYIDFSLNLDGMVLYANEHFSSIVKLPIDLENEVMIGPDFDFRPLYKTRQQNRRYYIMNISRNKIRLIEAFNDKLVQEINNNDFPFVNNDYHTEDQTKLALDTFTENQIKEFFNDADKRLQKYVNQFPLPIIFTGDVKNIAYFREEMDKNYMILGEVNGSYDEVSIHQILDAVSPVIETYRNEKQSEYLSDIDRGKSGILLENDPKEIYKMAIQGNAETLYLENNYLLNGEVEVVEQEDKLKVSDPPADKTENNRLLMTLLKVINENGGNIIFMDDGLLRKYDGMVLVKRF